MALDDNDSAVLDRLGVPLLSQAERVQKHGVDCGDGLHWHGWEIGGDYMKKLIVKNVSGRMQKLIYKLPATKFFYLEFPETIILSPGMTHTIVVNFRPIVKQAYADYIEFNSADGDTFYMPVWATLPRIAVNHVKQLDFGFCPVNEETLQTFTLTNTGDITAPFEWKFDNPPFRLTPESGTIEPGGKVQISVGFNPSNASALDARIECVVAGGAVVTSVDIKAISKFPFISFSESHLDFKNVLTGTRKEFNAKLKNQSLVPATFNMKALESDHDRVFYIKPESGVVPPNSELNMRVIYAPTTSGANHTDNFLFETPGGNDAKLVCSGVAQSPDVKLDLNIINFGDVMLGEKNEQELIIQNNSNCPVRFEFVEDDLSSFRTVPSRGVIAPLLFSSVSVVFKPKQTINYYKRHFCLILNQSQAPLYVDVVGTCYDNKASRPLPLENKHIARYREAIIKNPELRRATPEELLAALPGDGFELVPTPVEPSSIFHEYFADSSAEDVAECSILEQIVSFGSCAPAQSSEYKMITIKNHSKVKMTAVWDIAELAKGGGRAPLFSVFPTSQDIKANAAAEFKVTFFPRRDNFYYAQRLECYVYPKSQRTFRLVNEAAFVPPLKLHTMCIGNSFNPGAVHFIPQAVFSVSPTKAKGLECAGCTIGSSVYMTIGITNRGDTPLQFQFPEPEDPLGVFRISPSCGLIKQNRFELICVRFSPKHLPEALHKGEFAHLFDCVLNCNKAAPYKFKVCGRGYSVDIEFETGNNLFFKPTCRGMLSRRQHCIRNKTRVPLEYRWDIPKKYQNLLQVRPLSGVMQGNELLPITWQFMPDEIKAFNCRIPCYLKTQGETPHESRAILNVQGTCTNGVIEFEPPLVEFPTTQIVDSGDTRTFLLRNSSDCTLRYRLTVKDESPHAAGAADDGANGVIHFDHPTGEVHARSAKKVTVTFAPHAPHFHAYRVICTFGDASVAPEPESARQRGSKGKRGSRKKGKKGSNKKNSKKSRARQKIDSALALETRAQQMETQEFEVVSPKNGFSQTMECQVIGTGGFPLVYITDCRMDCASNLNRGLLDIWKTLNIDAINKEMTSPLTEAESDLNSDGLHSKITSFKAADLVPVLKNFDFNMGVGPANGPADIAIMKFKNTSDLVVDWAVKFPEDMEVDLNLWADTGDPTKKQRWQQAIADQGLFVVEPRHGRIQPGEECVVSITYFHKFVGSHELPVILHVKKGKHMCLNLIGSTVQSMPAVFSLEHLRPVPNGRLHRLEDVPLCMLPEDVPVQMFPLSNHSDSDVSYSVDLSAFDDATDANYGEAVWKCLNPTGVVAAGDVGYLRLLFQPIEAAIEQLSVAITMTNGDTTYTDVVVFCAGGYVLSERKEDEDPEEIYEISTAEAINNTSFPVKQLLSIPGQLAVPSTDYLYFGDLQPFACSHHTFAIINISNNPLVFEWLRLPQAGSVPNELETVSLNFKPSQGTVPAGGRVLIRIRLDAGCRPVVFDRDVMCKLTALDCETQETPQSGLTDTYSFEKIPMKTMRLPVAQTLNGRDKIHGTKHMKRTKPTYANDEERLLGSAMVTDSTFNIDEEAHITELRRRTTGQMHLRIVARVRTLNLLERQDDANRNHVRNTEVTAEPDVAMRTFVPLSNFTDEAPAKASADAQFEVGGMLLHRLVEDALKQTSVLQAFEELEIPHVPDHSGQFAPVPEPEPRVKNEEEQKEDRAFSKGTLNEFQGLAESLLSQTVFNLMQESMHGAFDLTALPRQIVTKGFRTEGAEEAS